jgi:hypothetical protein
VQEVRQEMPVGEDVRKPVPAPALLTLTLMLTGLAVKAALTVTGEETRKEQVVDVLPGQVPPDQPAKVALTGSATTAVSVTSWPELKEAEHAAEQEMPAGLEVTVPAASPEKVTPTA